MGSMKPETYMIYWCIENYIVAVVFSCMCTILYFRDLMEKYVPYRNRKKYNLLTVLI